MNPYPLDGTDQLARHVLAACVEPDGPVDVDGDQARVIDDARHPAFLAGGEAARPWDAATGARVRRPRRRRCSWPRLVAPLSRDHRPGRPWRRVDVGTAAPERCAWRHASDGAARAACRASGRDPGPATRCRPPGLPPSDGDAVVAGLAAGAKRVIGQGHGDDRIGRMALPEQIIDPAVLVLAIEGVEPRQLEFVALQGPLSPVTINHDLKLLRRMFNWGIRKGYIDRTPFKVGTEPVIRLEREIPRRKRFQNEDDEQRVLSVANHQLRGVIVTMLDTGCRPGEVMDMRWANVSFERREWVIVAQVEKTRNERIIPLSKRVMAVLELRRLDPSGEPFPPDAYVFGDSLGRKVKSVRAAFRNACEALKIDGLQLRDLRHEAASRFDEAGMPINYVSKFLGHTNLTTTTRYLNVLKRPRFSWTRIKGESNVQGGGGNGSVERRGTGRRIGTDGGSPEGDWSPCRRGGGRGGLAGAGAAVERQPEARRGAAAAAWRIAGGAVP